MLIVMDIAELVRLNELVNVRLIRQSICKHGQIIQVMSGHNGGKNRQESLRGGRIMTIEEMIKDADLEPKTINKVVKDFQKAG